MKRPPVYLTWAQRQRAADVIWESLARRSIEVVIVAVDRVHLHLLARFPDHDPRRWVGIAKKESSHYLKQECLAPVGGLWATRSKCKPIEDRSHQVRVVRYLQRHALQGAVLRTLKA